MRLAFVALLMAALPTAALAQAAGGAAPPSAANAAAKESMLEADVAWSDSTGKLGVGGFAARLWDVAVYLYPGTDVLRGRDRIFEFIGQQPREAREAELHWTPLRAAVSRDGTGGYTTGVLVAATTDASGERTTRFGRYITFWFREAHGAWTPIAVMHALGGLPNPAPVPERWTHPQGPMVSARVAANMAQADRDFAAMAAARGAQAAFVAFAAPDVVTVGREIAYGPAEIGAGFEGDRARWSWAPVLWWASEDGDLGFTVGEATIASVGPGGRDTSYSKYLTIWQRQPDGTYKFVTDGGNGRPARP
jgi:ketosteroid isomerase-like protein